MPQGSGVCCKNTLLEYYKLVSFSLFIFSTHINIIHYYSYVHVLMDSVYYLLILFVLNWQPNFYQNSLHTKRSIFAVPI